jgi:mRNA interferase RelE/StbE
MHLVKFTDQAVNDLEKLPKDIQKRIIKKLEFFASSTNPLQLASILTNFELGSYRFRIGDYRVIFDMDQNIILILSLGHRRNIYK